MAEPRLWIEIDPDLKDLVPGYLNRRHVDLEFGRDALLVGNFMALQKLGHNIRGSAGSFGFRGLNQIADRLEQAAVAQNGKALRCALDDMQTYLERIKVVYRPNGT